MLRPPGRAEVCNLRTKQRSRMVGKGFTSPANLIYTRRIGVWRELEIPSQGTGDSGMVLKSASSATQYTHDSTVRRHGSLTHRIFTSCILRSYHCNQTTKVLVRTCITLEETNLTSRLFGGAEDEVENDTNAKRDTRVSAECFVTWHTGNCPCSVVRCTRQSETTLDVQGKQLRTCFPTERRAQVHTCVQSGKSDPG